MNAKFTFLLLISPTIFLAACVQPAPDVLSPQEAITEAALGPANVAIFPSETPLLPAETNGSPTAELIEASETEMPQSPTSADITATFIPTDTQLPEETATEIPTNTPLATPLATFEPFSPDIAFGVPQIDELFFSEDSWIGTGGSLPDNDNIRIVVVDQEMRVTGKHILFDTWYFSWPTLDELYIEMTVDSGQCTGKDSYGLIIRGSATGDPSHGYVISFSCDGNYRVLRIDNGDLYNFTELISWTSSSNIFPGPNQLNILSVRADGENFTVYANGQQVATFFDDWYSFGRYGVFVNSGNTAAYTYRIQQIRVWRYLD